MQSKSTRGVQQDDVWTAADTLISEGLRPTIERVRLKIGRGSPNTVSPMLEAWFATLAPRLGVGDFKKDSQDLPPPVRLAAEKLWESALTAAQRVADGAIEKETQALAAERIDLIEREQELANQNRIQKELQTAAEDNLNAARSQCVDLSNRLETAQTRLTAQDDEIKDLRSKLDAIGKLRDAERLQSENENQRHAQERNRLAEQAANDQRRLLLEVDRTRDQAKRAEVALADCKRHTQASIQELETSNRFLKEKLIQTEGELRESTIALKSANDRASELRGLLDQERASTITALKQLSLQSGKIERKSKTVPTIKTRTVRRTI